MSMLEIDREARILITGGTGLVGRALSKVLSEKGFVNVTAVGSKACDLRDGESVRGLFAHLRPQYLFHLAARVYGIGGNQKYKADILFDNVMINTNVLEQARKAKVKKIVAMGSGCVYPEMPGQHELLENEIWLGPPHVSEDSYAHSKRLMLAQLQAMKEQDGMSSAFAISGNLYGPYDNFDELNGHVTPSLVAKFFEASQTGKPVTIWGTGIAVRDFTYSEDAAAALYEILVNLEGPVNLGSGYRHPIRDIVNALQEACGGAVRVEWDTSKPDGQLERYYNLGKLGSTGFYAKIPLAEGIRRTYEWYAEHVEQARK